MSYYRVPRMFEGETVAVLASGPSMSQEVADAVRGIPCIAVNDTFRLAPWAAILYAADRRWWLANPDAMEFPGVKIASPVGPGGDVKVLRQSGSVGFDPNPSMVRSGGNSGYQAVHVAIQAGAKRILLLGFDMHGTHFFGLHTKKAEGRALGNPNEQKFRVWIDRFGALRNRGAEIINCTPGSALDAFPKMSLDEVMAWI